MKRPIPLKSLLCAVLVLPALGCNLLKVTDDEDSKSGRGAKLHDPYQGANSGSVRLSLQMINGCAVLPTGQTVSPNGLNLPGYPQLCPNFSSPDPLGIPGEPTGTMKVLAKTKYFLNQLSITDTVLNQHMDPSNLGPAVRWITKESRFKKLNWSNLGQVNDEWRFIAGVSAASADSWTHEVFFGNADWQKVKDDTFTVDVVDPGGVVRATATYARSELLAESPDAGHSRFSWIVENAQPPRSPGDRELRGVVNRPGGLFLPLTFHTIARLDLVGSTNPFKTFEMPDLPGPAAIRVTWSQMPDDPFYFPVTIVSQDSVEATCKDDGGQAVKCGFGLDPRLTFAPPSQGSFYKPGETVFMYVDLRDSNGNRLHDKGLLPSAAEFLGDQANGLVMPLQPLSALTYEADATPMVTVAGPLQKMRVQPDPTVKPEYLGPAVPYPFIDDLTNSGIGPGLYTAKFTTRQTVKIPADATPGTYVAMVKFTRYFLGERVTKLNPVFFQVGQDERTTYPNAVGSCQICHKGVLSLDNLRHGLAVDHIEACKTCHLFNTDVLGRPQEFIHRIHMNSPRYTANKADCTLCHLTRESALRPSLAVCTSCHPSAHDSKYFTMSFSTGGESRFATCAQTCHGDLAPAHHILPPAQ